MSLFILCVKCPLILLIIFMTVLSVFVICYWKDSNVTSLMTKQSSVTKNVSKTLDTADVVTDTYQKLSLRFKADNHINEDRLVTENSESLFQARRAYFAIHGRSISETKCLEYTRHHDSLLNENKVGIYSKTVYDRNVSERFIVGTGDGIAGRDVTHGEFPHMGALGWLDLTFNWVFKCGSSLISPNFLLTAAHCSWVSPRRFNLFDPKPQIVRLGTKNILENRALHYFDVDIVQIIVHPEYKSPLKYNDIALMRLKIKVPFNLHLAPACLWRDPYVAAGTAVFGTGWGYTSLVVKSMSAELQAVEIEIIDSGLCNRILNVMWNRNFKGLRSHQICAGKLEGGVDTCQGDSGGPIQVKIPCALFSEASLSSVIGVTSFGFGCARAGMPSVYTRVSSYIDWIEDNVWEKELKLYKNKEF